jgi:hypothetical protein
MKIWSKAKHRTLASAAIIFLVANSASVKGGIINMLRGESTEPEPQRVAFVGGAHVKEVRGSVERLAGVDRWETLLVGATLLPGDVVRTAAGSAVLCMKESKSFVKITPNTLLRLVDLESDWDPGVLSGREERTGFVVRSCRGEAFVADARGDWKKVQVNDVLAAGSALRTSPGAVVDLFHNTSKQPLRIPGSAQLRLDTPVLARAATAQPTFASAKR